LKLLSGIQNTGAVCRSAKRKPGDTVSADSLIAIPGIANNYSALAPLLQRP
jgi:hypothetical protein